MQQNKEDIATLCKAIENVSLTLAAQSQASLGLANALDSLTRLQNATAPSAPPSDVLVARAMTDVEKGEFVVTPRVMTRVSRVKKKR